MGNILMVPCRNVNEVNQKQALETIVQLIH